MPEKLDVKRGAKNREPNKFQFCNCGWVHSNFKRSSLQRFFSESLKKFSLKKNSFLSSSLAKEFSS